MLPIKPIRTHQQHASSVIPPKNEISTCLTYIFVVAVTERFISTMAQSQIKENYSKFKFNLYCLLYRNCLKLLGAVFLLTIIYQSVFTFKLRG